MSRKKCNGCEPSKAKKYNRRILIQKKQATIDPEGIPTGESWITVMTLWAHRKPLTVRWREYFQAAGENAEKMLQYEIRYRQGITEDMRIEEGSRTYEMKAVLDDIHGDRTETWLMGLELTGG